MAFAIIFSQAFANIRGARQDQEDEFSDRDLRRSSNIFSEEDADESSQENDFGKHSRIIGGSKAATSRFPYLVSLQDSFGHYCGGALVAPNIVLTAA